MQDVAQSALNLVLSRAVDCAGRIIEHQNTRVGQERARDGDALTLSAGERHAAFTHHRVVPTLEVRDKVMGLGLLCYRFNFLAGDRSAHTKGDIFRQRPRKEEDILIDGGNLRAKRFHRPHAHVHAVDQHAPLPRPRRCGL